MISAEVIIVGAGASGLMIARRLSQAGLKVIVLEARDRLGGRIFTLEDKGFPMPLEAGAEFIHGNLPVTIGLLEEAGIGYRVSGGEAWRFSKGAFMQEDDFIEHGDLVVKKLRELKKDITVAVFLHTYFGEAGYTGIRDSVKNFVEGYDAADINRASAFTLRKEWADNEEWEQYRVNGGYTGMIHFLENECRKNGCSLFTSSIVKQINWQSGGVEVVTGNHQRYSGKKIVVTVPLGVLHAGSQAEAGIHFSPALPGNAGSMQALGFGNVVKVMILFSQAFWKDKKLPGNPGKTLANMGWLFSGESIPTWWTQVPDDSALLTGWLAGPKAALLKDAGDDEIFDQALQSLGIFFEMSRESLQEKISRFYITNWAADPFSLCAYSYATPETARAIKQLSIPVANTIYFAGEALYDGADIGTVEGALANGLQVAKLVLENV